MIVVELCWQPESFDNTFILLSLFGCHRGEMQWLVAIRCSLTDRHVLCHWYERDRRMSELR